MENEQAKVQRGLQSAKESPATRSSASTIELPGDKIIHGQRAKEVEECKASVKRYGLEYRIANTQHADIVPEAVVEETDSLISAEETNIPTDGNDKATDRLRRAKLPTPPPSKNVSFDELDDRDYSRESILPPSGTQFVSKYRCAGKINCRKTIV